MLYIIFTIIYIAGVTWYILNLAPLTDTKLCKRDGSSVGNLDIYSYKDTTRDTTPKDMRMSLIWPILSLLWLIKTIIWILNELISFILLIFNYNYKKSKVYKFINVKFG